MGWGLTRSRNTLLAPYRYFLTQRNLVDVRMTRRGTCWSSLSIRHAIVVALLLAFCLTGPGGLVAPAPAHAAGLHSAAPPTVTVGGYFQEFAGNRTRMIQVGCIIAAIGIFLLTRTYR
jgi:hypothetical protein